MQKSLNSEKKIKNFKLRTIEINAQESFEFLWMQFVQTGEADFEVLSPSGPDQCKLNTNNILENQPTIKIRKKSTQ